ncbi:MAG: hypothetical protein IJM33_02730 [Bacteroidales bacterium]|nr:hypothetical protein [Bacteroidales bacterium]
MGEGYGAGGVGEKRKPRRSSGLGCCGGALCCRLRVGAVVAVGRGVGGYG